MTINPAVYAKLSYSPERDFSPISLLAEFPLLLAVGAEQPLKTVRELVEYGRAHPASSPTTPRAPRPSSSRSELFNQRTGSKFQHIPYRGSGDAVQAVAAGQVLMTIADSGPHVGPAEGRKAAGARPHGRQAQPGLSRRADHGRGRHPRHGDLAVDRHRGAGRHAGRDRGATAGRDRRDRWRWPTCSTAMDAIAVDPRSTTPDEYPRPDRPRHGALEGKSPPPPTSSSSERHGHQQRGPPFGGALFPRRPERDRLRLSVLQLRHRPRAADRGHGRLQARRPQVPATILCPHENIAVHMAAGYAIATGRGQGVHGPRRRRHRQFGDGVAQSLPRPHPGAADGGQGTLHHARRASGTRDTYVHFVQEPFDQASVVRPYIKWEYNLPSGVIAKEALRRAHTVMQSDPRGPGLSHLPARDADRAVVGGPDPLVSRGALRAGRRRAPPTPRSIDAIVDQAARGRAAPADLVLCRPQPCHRRR